MRAALACSGDVVYSWDLVRDNISWIGNTSDMFGGAASEAVLSGDSFHERINPDDLKTRLKFLSKHFTTCEPFIAVSRPTEKGGFCWIHARRPSFEAASRCA
jgi:hypothetical protein